MSIDERESFRFRARALALAMVAGGGITAQAAWAEPVTSFNWATVANNTMVFPTDTRNFNSYNQPSVNDAGLVVFRARTQGGQPGGEPLTGILTRDMSSPGNPLTVIASRTTIAPVPAPDPAEPGYTYTPTLKTFNEFPAIPRIDSGSSTIATRGQTPPVLEISHIEIQVIDGVETPVEVKEKVGTAAIYSNPGGTLVSAVSNFGTQPGFERYLVPEQPTDIKFDQFPGSPTVTDGSKIAFKGNFVGGTGVYWTDAANPTSPVYAIASSTQTTATIDGLAVPAPFFGGSTSPPSAADGKAVFLGVDNEDDPTKGGIYLAPLVTSNYPSLTEIIGIGDSLGFDVATASSDTFTRLGEALSFDGRYLAFWAGIGAETRSYTLQCAGDGNQSVLNYCNQQYPDGFLATVPLNQGIFLADIVDGSIDLVASTWGSDGFTDFLYWGFTGRPPGTGSGDEEAEELARWRNSSFVAVDNGRVAFKGSKGDSFGLYLFTGLSDPLSTIAEKGQDGSLIDPYATGMPITALGIERDGFRNGWLAITASMANEEESMAGVYVARVPEPGTLALTSLAGLLMLRSRRRQTA